jgi:hypothetical protein
MPMHVNNDGRASNVALINDKPAEEDVGKRELRHHPCNYNVLPSAAAVNNQASGSDHIDVLWQLQEEYPRLNSIMEDIKECMGWLQDDDKCKTSTSDLGGENTASDIVNCYDNDNAKSTGMSIQSLSGHKAMIYCKETLPQLWKYLCHLLMYTCTWASGKGT